MGKTRAFDTTISTTDNGERFTTYGIADSVNGAAAHKA
jgi:aspartate 1-decarboxylase